MYRCVFINHYLRSISIMCKTFLSFVFILCFEYCFPFQYHGFVLDALEHRISTFFLLHQLFNLTRNAINDTTVNALNVLCSRTFCIDHIFYSSDILVYAHNHNNSYSFEVSLIENVLISTTCEDQL